MILPKKDRYNNYFVTFDFEAILEKKPEEDKKRGSRRVKANWDKYFINKRWISLSNAFFCLFSYIKMSQQTNPPKNGRLKVIKTFQKTDLWIDRLTCQEESTGFGALNFYHIWNKVRKLFWILIQSQLVIAPRRRALKQSMDTTM